MKKTSVFSLLLVMTLCSTAFATDLINGDSKAYKFKLVDGSVTSSRHIRAHGSMYGLCTPNSKCKIILNGRTSPEFNSNSKLKIEGGAVKVQ